MGLDSGRVLTRSMFREVDGYTCARALLLARIFLVLHIIRKKIGVPFLGELMCLRKHFEGFCSDIVTAETWQLLLSAVFLKLTKSTLEELCV